MAEAANVSAGWRKSSRSESGSCVEVRIGADEVQVRSSRSPHGPIIAFTLTEWQAFLDGVELGEFRPTLS